MKKYLIIFFILFSVLQAKTYNETITDFEIVRVRDGDTFIINIKGIPQIFGSEIAVRIRGIDTPELSNSRKDIKDIAYKAKFELEKY